MLLRSIGAGKLPRERPMTTPRRSLLFTCSTFLSKPGKVAQLRTALGSILAHEAERRHLIGEMIVVNEYGGADPRDHAPLVRAIDPSIAFLQKGPGERGQARTLNLLLERARGYDYWVHWEESWACCAPFLARALDVMESSPFTQLQLTCDWLDVGDERVSREATAGGTEYARIGPHPRTPEVLRGATIDDYDELVRKESMAVAWPLFSLRPSVNRAAFCREVGPFDEDPRYWPVRFEWDYAARWFARGGTKAVLLPHAAERQPGHVSTYR